MPTFEIRYEDFVRGPIALSGCHLFDVRFAGDEALVGVEFLDQLQRQWALDGRANADEIERRAALACPKEHLSRVGTLTGQHGQRLLLTAWDPPELGDEWTVYKVPKDCPYEWKECDFQERGRTGTMCRAAHPRDLAQRRTTRAACERCGLPSMDILCRNLVDFETTGAEAGGRLERSLVGARCDIESEEFADPTRDAKRCVPGGWDCWVQTYAPEEAVPPAVPAAAQFSIADAIDQLNTAFRKRYKRRLIEIEHARSIEDLMGECPTDEAFQHKLQVVAGLLEGMQLSRLLTGQEAEGSQGSIDLLDRLSARDFSRVPAQYLRSLRNINKLSAGYPRHPKVKNIERAHAELGLPYPVTDYAKGWAIVSETFIQTLRQLALHLG